MYASVTLLVCLCDARRVHKAYKSKLIKLLRVNQLTGRFKIPNRFVKLFLGSVALPIVSSPQTFDEISFAVH